MESRRANGAHEVFATFGFGEIRVPIFEPTELFARAVGGETDIVSKEMYTFEDRDETTIEACGRRPDGELFAALTLSMGCRRCRSR